jgi:hypothetical protein
MLRHAKWASYMRPHWFVVSCRASGRTPQKALGSDYPRAFSIWVSRIADSEQPQSLQGGIDPHQFASGFVAGSLASCGASDVDYRVAIREFYDER